MDSHGKIWAARSGTVVTFRQQYCFSNTINLLELTDFSKVDARFLVNCDGAKFGRVQKGCEGSCIQQTKLYDSGAGR